MAQTREQKKAYYQVHKEELQAYARKYRQAHKGEKREYNRIRHRQYTQKIKKDILGHYSNGRPICTVCGESRLACLSIDHINGGGRAHNRNLGLRGANFYSWLKHQKYPEGFQVLCMNCQFIKKEEEGEQTKCQS